MSKKGNIKVWDIVKISTDDVKYDVYNGRECIVRQIFKSGIYLLGLPGGADELRIAKKHLELVKSYDSKSGNWWRNEDYDVLHNK